MPLHRPRMRMPSIKMVLLLLTGGAIINVAVAWGCALWSPEKLWSLPGNWSSTPVSAADLHWIEDRGYKVHPVPKLIDGSSHGVAVHVVRLEWPAWIRKVFDSGFDIEFGYVPSAWKIREGWPVHSLTSECWVTGDTTPESTRHHTERRWAIKSEQLHGGLSPKCFATRPIWPGFAINTVFYAAMLWLLLFGPGKIRRFIRARRGQCPACAYPIGTSEVCTECGRTIPRK